MNSNKRTASFLAVAAWLLLGIASGAQANFHGTGVPVLVEAEPPFCKSDAECPYGDQCNTGTGICFTPSSATSCACTDDGDACTDDTAILVGSSCYCPHNVIPGCRKDDGTPVVETPPVVVTPTPVGKVPPLDPITGTPDPVTPVTPDPEPLPTPPIPPPATPPTTPPVTEIPSGDDDSGDDVTEPEPDHDCTDGVIVLGECKPKDFVHMQGGGDGGGCSLIR